MALYFFSPLSWNSHRWLLGVPLLGFAALLVVLFLVDLDLPLAERYYDGETGKWPALWQQPWTFLNLYGEFPGLIPGVGALIVLLLSIGRPTLHASRKVCSFLLAGLAVGPGIVVNSLLKEYWGRPRPNASEPFDGRFPYERFLRFDPESTGGSFPSGHASMGFYVLAIGLLLLAAGRRRLGQAVVLGSIALGFFIGFSRVCSGKHFLSDVVSAGLIVWACTIATFFAMRMHRSLRFAPRPLKPDTVPVRVMRIFSPVLVLVILGLAAVKWPLFRRDIMVLEAPPTTAPLHLDIKAEGRLSVVSGPELRFTTITDGHGLANARIVTNQSYADGTLTISNEREGLFWKAHPILELTLPPDRSFRLTFGEKVSSWNTKWFRPPAAGSPHTVEFPEIEDED